MIPGFSRTRKGDRPFEDERHLLGWLLDRLAAPSRSHLDLTAASPEQVFIHGVVAPLFRAQIAYGRAVYRLSGLQLSEAAYPICRSMLELRAEMGYILERAPEVERAFASMLWLVLVLQSPPGKPWPDLVSAASDLRQYDPDLYASLSARFTKRRFAHHSGQGWSTLVERYGGASGKASYGFLSWHTHALAQGVAEVEYRTDQSRVIRRYKQARPEHRAKIDVATVAVDALTGTWENITEAFGSVAKPARRRRGPLVV